MIEILVKYNIGDYVTLISGEDKMRVVGYEYMEGRGMRYIMTEKHEYRYHYENEIKKHVESGKIGFVVQQGE